MAVSGLLGLVIYLAVACVVVYLIFLLIGMLSIPQPIKNVILIVISLIIIVWLLTTFVPGIY